MSGVFISYRRDDSKPYAGRLSDRLGARFGKARVFMDVGHIGLGQDFVEVMGRAVDDCDAFVALIGPRWLDAVDGTGRRRLDDYDDFVRIEIRSALERRTPVFPVLVDDARMPAFRDLPTDLAALAHRHALNVSDERWDYDTGRLIETLELYLSPEPANDRTRTPGPAPAYPTAGPAAVGYAPPPPVPQLGQLLPGTWQVQLQHPQAGVAQGVFSFAPAGLFQGRIAGPLGQFEVSGQWGLTGPAQLQLAGTQTNGFSSLPYQAFITFTGTSPAQLGGHTTAGESVAFHRIG